MLNRCILIGRLTKDPEIRHTPNTGTAVTTFTLAVDRAFKKDEADFIPVVTWKKTAENCAQYLTKGSLVAVDGRIQVRSYEHEGKRRYATEVVAEDVRFLDTRKKGDKDPLEDFGREVDVDPDKIPF